MKKLIISQNQFRMLAEANLGGNENSSQYSMSFDQYSQSPTDATSNLEVGDTMNITPDVGNENGSMSGINKKMDDINPTSDDTQHSMNGGNLSYTKVEESISLKKEDVENARKKSKVMHIGDKVYSKRDFTKKLNEDYKSFHNRLNEKRKNYGK